MQYVVLSLYILLSQDITHPVIAWFYFICICLHKQDIRRPVFSISIFMPTQTRGNKSQVYISVCLHNQQITRTVFSLSICL